MKENSEILVSGITFIKNGLTLGYPIRESIESIDELCDEVIINVGFNDKELTEDDGTYEYLKSHFTESKYKFLKSWWDPSLTKKGLILSEQTNIALKEASGKYCQYIQGDECLHEEDITLIKKSIREMEDRNEIDGVVFKYIHFYGSTNVQKITKKTYRREVRLIRNNIGIKSWLDAQGFRRNDDSKLNCIETTAKVYHYGWARQEVVMNKKTEAFEKLYHGKDHKIEQFSYKRIWGLRPFEATHPRVMFKWIQENKNDVDILSLRPEYGLKDTRIILSDFFEYATGIRIGEYKNFNLI